MIIYKNLFLFYNSFKKLNKIIYRLFKKFILCNLKKLVNLKKF